MTALAVLQIAIFLAVLTALAVPLGAYLQRVFAGGHVALEAARASVERGVYRPNLLRTDNATSAAVLAVGIVVIVVVSLLPALAIGPLAGKLR